MPITDPYAGFGKSPDGPYENAVDVTANDDTDLPVIPGAIVINAALSEPLPVQMRLKGGATVRVFLKPGVIHRIRPTRIFATGTFGDPSLTPSNQAITLLW
ncbi:hypothetical protein HW561_04755 [Rhodobacteraceae bacterium B1Z28]|uniref:Uncharacterized protein n=1 Tax=Ruegeria haliotis TaxID=2747601 RepID=A0ABX2PMX7_9RHOB|nr:hypothetical protein [Ruegeria haliotis]NVO55100.1 hypothetical protein [Ruegeria haliotis]